MSDRIWATTVGADDCAAFEDTSGIATSAFAPCSMCAGLIAGLHIHVEVTRASTDGEWTAAEAHIWEKLIGLRIVLGFCSEECAGRWRSGEPLAADRIVT